MRNRSQILLRKINGVLAACWSSGSPAPTGGVSTSYHPSLLGTVAAFAMALLMPLLALGAAVALLALVATPTAPAPEHLTLMGIGVMGTTEAIKAAIDELGKAFNEFKASNDERIKQVETKGSADPVLLAKVDASNKAITDLQAQIREMETAVNRVGFGAGGSAADRADAEVRDAQSFFSGIQGRRITMDEARAQVPKLREYKAALETYLRVGEKGCSAEILNTLSVGTDPAGGYMVTPDNSGKIVELIRESSPMRQHATVLTTGKDVVEGSTDLDEAGAGWVGETEDRDETTTPEVGEWRIDIHEAYAEPRATQKNLDDADFDLESWLQRKVSERLARLENAGFVGGNGVKKPRGFTDYPAATAKMTKALWGKIRQINSGANGAFAASNPGDKLIDLVFAIPAELRNGAVWCANSLTFAELRKLKDGDGNYLWQPDFTNLANSRLLGFGTAEFQDMADLATASLSLGFGNLKEAYEIRDRKGIAVLRDPLTKKGWVKFYTTKRVGGAVTNFQALVLMKFSA